MALRKTLENRPDLIERAELSEQDRRLLREIEAELRRRSGESA
jgi:tRNA (guanine37-N1)-methyltransferase